MRTDRNPLFLVEENLVDYYASFGCLPGAEWERGQQSRWILTGIPPINRVMYAHWGPDEVDLMIQDLKERFRAWRVG